MNRVAIFGVGLIGGSFALALRKAGFQGEIVGVSSARTIELARGMGVIDRGVTSAEAAATAELLYLSQPILTIIDTLGDIGPQVPRGTLVTDAGSTKNLIVEKAARTLPIGKFLGGHPMAGKERSGVTEADADLFAGRPYVLTPTHPDELLTPACQEFRQWVTRIGAVPVILNPDDHDRLVAFTSHAPQLISTALASVLAQVEGAPAVAGPGIVGLTRLALSPFNVWRDILLTNPQHIDEAIAALIGKLERLRSELKSPSIEEEFDIAAQLARRLRENLPV
jgi:prephenate dehydrogenase